MKRKAYGAVNPLLAYYADHIELSDGGCDFATQIGIGGVVGSKFTLPSRSSSGARPPARAPAVRKL